MKLMEFATLNTGKKSGKNLKETSTVKNIPNTHRPKAFPALEPFIRRNNGLVFIDLEDIPKAVTAFQEKQQELGQKPYSEVRVLDILHNQKLLPDEKEGVLEALFPRANPLRVVKAREQQKLSLKEFSEKMGVKANIVGGYESGYHPLRGKALENYARLLGVLPEELTEATPEEKKLLSRKASPFWIQKAREEAGMTAEQAAILLGLRQGGLSRYETGKTTFPPSRLTKYAAIVNKPIEYFFQDPPKPISEISPDEKLVIPYGGVDWGEENQEMPTEPRRIETKPVKLSQMLLDFATRIEELENDMERASNTQKKYELVIEEQDKLITNLKKDLLK